MALTFQALQADTLLKPDRHFGVIHVSGHHGTCTSEVFTCTRRPAHHLLSNCCVVVLNHSGSQPGSGAASASLTYLFPLPPEYERALHKKLTMTAELRQRFRAAGLTKEREAELNNAIQAYFKVGMVGLKGG
jgi:hypothetical protein